MTTRSVTTTVLQDMIAARSGSSFGADINDPEVYARLKAAGLTDEQIKSGQSYSTDGATQARMAGAASGGKTLMVGVLVVGLAVGGFLYMRK